MCKLVEDARIPLQADCDEETMGEISGALSRALITFLVGAKAALESPPAVMRKWAAGIEKCARGLLENIGVTELHDDRTQRKAAELFVDALMVSHAAAPPPGQDEDPAVKAQRERDGRFVFNISRASSLAFDEPSPEFAHIERAFHAVRLLSLLAQKVKELNAEPGKREKETHLIALLATIMDAYERLTGKHATVTVNPFVPGTPRGGPAVEFAAATLLLLASRCPDDLRRLLTRKARSTAIDKLFRQVDKDRSSRQRKR